MSFLNDLVYGSLLGIIGLYKWIELQVLKLLNPWIRRKALELAESVGIVLHLPGDGKDDEWILDNEKKILQKCKKKYDKLLHLKVNDPEKFFIKIANRGTCGFGEGYMEGLFDVWESENDLTELTFRVLENNMMDMYWNKWNRFLEWIELAAFNLQTKSRAFQVGREHYDLGNDLYEKMLDPWMQYTCAYWASAKTLDEAQLDKLELIAKKLDLKPGMRVLDIGCGWGTLCKYLAEKYGVECVGVTISEEGVAYGRKINEGLPVDIRLQDYRDVDEKFDRVVSIGCLEHVGFKNYRTFMEVVKRCLVDDGVFLLHSISRNHPNIPRSDPWVHKYIFPNGNLPNPRDIADATEGHFIIEDWHNIGPDYAKTLAGWRKNFLEAWPTLKKKYDVGQFYKMWIFYLCLSEGLFKSRRLHLWQIVLSKDGLKREYRAAR